MSRTIVNVPTNPAAARSGSAWLRNGSAALLLAAAMLLPNAADAVVLTVTSTNDSGSGSLRQAILDANSLLGADEIRFNLGANKTITLATKLPSLKTPIDVNGTSQPGWSGTPLIVIDGHNVAQDGFVVTSRNCKIRGLVINDFGGNGIAISGADDVTVQGNWIGLNAAGTAAVPNGGSGIAASGASLSHRIGGTTAAQRNVISGNAENGILLLDTSGDSVISGNYIGTDAAGTLAVPNAVNGVRIVSSGNRIGGTAAGEGNVISGNAYAGLVLEGPGNDVQGNVIGMNATETAKVPNLVIGVRILAGPNVIGSTGPAGVNVISGNGAAGVSIEQAATGVSIVNNRIGTDRIGIVGWGNEDEGIAVFGDGNTVGGPTGAHGNVISGNGLAGVQIVGDGNAVLNNLIGLNTPGTGPLANETGVFVRGAMNTIGAPGQGNVISGNDGFGVAIHDGNATGNVVQANLIGTRPDGTTAVRTHFTGIDVRNASDNLIGGQGAGEGNLVTQSRYYGVYVTSGTGNAILGNSIFENGAVGIDLAPYGSAQNDPGDVDSGPNRSQNYPVLSQVSASPGVSTFFGALSSTPNSSFTIELFSSPACDLTGLGEGKTLVGRFTAQTNAAGKAILQKTLNVTLADPWVTATATNDATLDTSEFSTCVVANVATPGALQFTGGFTGFESDPDGLVPVTVARLGGSSGTVSVDYATSSSEATPGADYEDVSGTLTFLDGEVVKTVYVPVHADADVNEAPEKVDLVLSNPTGGATLAALATADLLIIDASPATPEAYVSDARVVEGPNGSTRKLQFVISLSAHDLPVSVSWYAIPGTATEGDDFDQAGGFVSFQVGELEKIVEVTVHGDGVTEGAETVFVEIVGVDTGLIGDGGSVGTGTIYDADGVGAAALCTNGGVIAKPKIVVNGLAGNGGDEVVKLRGKIKFPGGQPNGFSPLGAASRGAQILIEDLGADGAPIWELSHRTAPVPGGLLDDVCTAGLLDGWTVGGTQKKYEYTNASGRLANACASGSARGLKLFRLLDRRDTFTQAIEFTGKTRPTTVAEPFGPLRLTVVLGSAQAVGQNGACATFTFDPVDCKRNATATKLVCR